ncbi:MAG: FtsQ-type POTRA domain-containing protein [Nocardioidaceae bacterium]|nr:FtsQ-type POTRA domain-containing protein [Nocardioidaceae bacterium]
MTGTELHDTTERTRKRFARRQWSRRWLTWKPVVGVALLVLLAGVLLWLVYFSSYLAVQGVDVRGTSQLRESQVVAAAAVPDGEALATVDLDRIRARVEALAPVRSADVSREWPDRVRIDVTERTPVAVVEIAGHLQGMDEDGVVFRDYARPPADLPRVESGPDAGSDALREAALVVAALPEDLAAKVDHVQVDTVDQITLVLRDGRTVRWGSSADSDLKAEVLAQLIAARSAQAYDVSVPGQPTTSGAP